MANKFEIFKFRPSQLEEGVEVFSIRASVPAGIFPGISAFFNGEGFGGGRSRALKRIRTIVTGIYPGATYGIEKYVHIVEAAWPDGSREGPTYELDVGIYRNK